MQGNQDIFDQHLKAMQRVFDTFPQMAANHARNFFDKSFTNKGFTDRALDPWKPVRDKGGKDKERPLVKTGRLRRSIRTAPGLVFTDVEYAAIHNEGGTITRHARSETFVRNRFTKGKRKGKFKKGSSSGQGFTFKASSGTMPKRQFMGPSVTLDQELEELAVDMINKAFSKP